MARGRMLSKSLSTSTKRARLRSVLGPLTEFAQALYPLLVAHSDDFGREVADPFTVKNTVDPTTTRTLLEVAEALVAMHRVGLLTLYADGDRFLLQITDFDTHQSGLHKRSRSKFPDPPPESPGISGEFLSRARAELELEREENLTLKNALRAEKPQARPVEKLPRPVDKPKVDTLAALIRENVLPLGIDDDGDLFDAAKRAAAKHHLKYTGSAIRRALASAIAQQQRKGARS